MFKAWKLCFLSKSSFSPIVKRIRWILGHWDLRYLPYPSWPCLHPCEESRAPCYWLLWDMFQIFLEISILCSTTKRQICFHFSTFINWNHVKLQRNIKIKIQSVCLSWLTLFLYHSGCLFSLIKTSVKQSNSVIKKKVSPNLAWSLLSALPTTIPSNFRACIIKKGICNKL